MRRPLVVIARNAEVAGALGVDLRYPVLEDPVHLEVMVVQGFSCVAVCDADGLDCEIVVIPEDLDLGGAHQLIASDPALDPLKLNADVGTFAWTTNEDGEVLLVRQAYGHQVWALPGGELHVAETPDVAVTREVREETGYDVNVDRVVALYGRQQHIGIYFACSLVGGTQRTDFDTEVAEIGWFDPADPPPRTSPVIGLLRGDIASGSVPARFFG